MHQDIIYNSIGSGYNSTRRADPYIADRLYGLLTPAADGIYLDMGCGTGNYTVALAEKGTHLYGIDPSDRMLGIARQRNPAIQWVEGKAEKLPFGDAFFDGALATLTIHHWSGLRQGFAELYRVLKQGGRFVLFTATPQQMARYWLSHYFPVMMAHSMTQMPGMDVVSEALSDAGFDLLQTEKYFIRDDLQDHFLYVGKNHPQLYLNKEVRAGISSFAALADAAETDKGLNELTRDLETGRFDGVKEAFENDLGDYIFIVAQKC